MWSSQPSCKPSQETSGWVEEKEEEVSSPGAELHSLFLSSVTGGQGAAVPFVRCSGEAPAGEARAGRLQEAEEGGRSGEGSDDVDVSQ